MRGVNKTILIGNLGADPTVRYSPSGAAVANLNIATTNAWKDRETGELQEATEWHRLVCFGRTAEIAGEYLKKGSQIYVEGRLQTRKWEDREGIERYTTEVVVNDLQMLGTRGGGSGQDQGGGHSSGGSSSGSGQASYPASDPAREDFDDDIPF